MVTTPSSDIIVAIPSLNPELLQLCRVCIPAYAPVLVLDGSRGMYGMRAIVHLIETTACRTVILLDEDAFIMDFQKLMNLVAWAAAEDVVCVGVGDGGVMPGRHHNPNAFNTFFNIIDVERIRGRWDRAACRAHKGLGRSMTELWCPTGILTPGVPYEFDDFEPYYCFYFWLHSVGVRMEWLTARTHDDGISTLLCDKRDEPFLLHTWYSRRFSSDSWQRQRILAAALWVCSRQNVRAEVVPWTAERPGSCALALNEIAAKTH